MRLLLVLAILLAFPILEIYVIAKLAAIYGWWMALYLLVTAIAGIALIKEERFAVFGRIFTMMQRGQHPMHALFASARKVLAGLLLLFPGVISDVIAIILLLIPMPHTGVNRPAANDDIIEGEWRREE
ncbi:exlusion protein FxsA [Novimethylophilus kurashikiensis]|uniref:Exlusion protein FxsA n=1 Tax=Novimethylophilus kurashikiensis TaxID=1825523 RepID=A0A2R5FBF2_9PROT|nr:FxsA family protein [Novimethylophilus kurashikiensis]GBG13954.1 exlusion protein FxsA [Novimethylophilus kurashikiensis]